MIPSKIGLRAGCVVLTVLGGAAMDASACYKPKRPNPPMPMVPPDPPPRIWRRFDPNGVTVWVELRSIFPTTTDHSCSGAVGLGSVLRPLPGGVTLDTAGTPLTVGVLDPNTLTLAPTFPQFNTLQYDPVCTAAWAAGPSFSDPYTGTPETLNWFGFCGIVSPVSPPQPLPGVPVLCFRIDFGGGGFPDPTYIDAQIGGGLGTSNGSPLFQTQANENDHFATYSSVVVICIPAPAPGLVGVLAAVPLLSRRRRTA